MCSTRKTYLKILFGVFITIFAAITCLSSSSLTSNNITYQNFDMVSDAMENIKTQLEKEKHTYLICMKYNFSPEGKLIKKTTKSHSDQYRKKPSFEEKFYTTDSNLDTGRVVEFVYRSSANKLITEITFLKGKKSKNTVRHGFDRTTI
ncbi:MAG: hypothetical protein WC436_00595 [Candidatus Babeliales bacterium]